MTYAYDEIYVLKAQEAMGSMLHYAVYDLKMEIDAFFLEFISSGIAHRFGMGEPKYIVGMSGIEIAREVCSITRGTEPDVEPAVFYGRTAEYWAGWALAYYEWCRNMDFRRINDAVPITEIVEMYDPYHEADITRFVDEIDRRISERNRVTCLARFRAYSEMTQKMLADRSGVSIRMIEQYEQGRKDIKNASAATVYRLARALNCRMEELIG